MAADAPDVAEGGDSQDFADLQPEVFGQNHIGVAMFVFIPLGDFIQSNEIRRHKFVRNIRLSRLGFRPGMTESAFFHADVPSLHRRRFRQFFGTNGLPLGDGAPHESAGKAKSS
jgi:hypothetical protein